MKFLFIIGVIVFAAWGSVGGVKNLLSADDLEKCNGPSLTDPSCGSADVIVAISGGDTSARVAESIKLFNAGWAPKLVFSGAALDKSGSSNAEAMRRQALVAGVPESAILIEKDALDTAENALRTSALVGSVDRIILVTSPYHQRRAGLEFKYAFGNQVDVVSHPTPYDRLWPTYWWTTWNGWSLALSESVKTLFVMWAPR